MRQFNLLAARVSAIGRLQRSHVYVNERDFVSGGDYKGFDELEKVFRALFLCGVSAPSALMLRLIHF